MIYGFWVGHKFLIRWYIYKLSCIFLEALAGYQIIFFSTHHTKEQENKKKRPLPTPLAAASAKKKMKPAEPATPPPWTTTVLPNGSASSSRGEGALEPEIDTTLAAIHECQRGSWRWGTPQWSCPHCRLLRQYLDGAWPSAAWPMVEILPWVWLEPMEGLQSDLAMIFFPLDHPSEVQLPTQTLQSCWIYFFYLCKLFPWNNCRMMKNPKEVEDGATRKQFWYTRTQKATLSSCRSFWTAGLPIQVWCMWSAGLKKCTKA